MVVTVMSIRKVRMRMPQRFMPVPMGMAGSGLNGGLMLVVVVRIAIVNMLVLMFEDFVHVFVLMPLAQVQPDAEAH